MFYFLTFPVSSFDTFWYLSYTDKTQSQYFSFIHIGQRITNEKDRFFLHKIQQLSNRNRPVIWLGVGPVSVSRTQNSSDRQSLLAQTKFHTRTTKRWISSDTLLPFPRLCGDGDLWNNILGSNFNSEEQVSFFFPCDTLTKSMLSKTELLRFSTCPEHVCLRAGSEELFFSIYSSMSNLLILLCKKKQTHTNQNLYQWIIFIFPPVSRIPPSSPGPLENSTDTFRTYKVVFILWRT